MFLGGGACDLTSMKTDFIAESGGLENDSRLVSLVRVTAETGSAGGAAYKHR